MQIHRSHARSSVGLLLLFGLVGCMQHVRTRVVLKRSRDVAGPFRTPSSLNSAQSEASGLYKSAHFAWLSTASRRAISRSCPAQIVLKTEVKAAKCEHFGSYKGGLFR